jgi:hypothetical protein
MQNSAGIPTVHTAQVHCADVTDSRVYRTLRQSKAWDLTDSAARLERFGT